MIEIPLQDECDNLLGQFSNYDVWDVTQAAQLHQQKHVDIRSFSPSPGTRRTPMLLLDQDEMTDMDGMDMQELEDPTAIASAENWSVGTIGPQSDRNYWNGLSLSCVTGANTTVSASTALLTNAIDISSFATSDVISIALPTLPLASLTTSQCFVDFSTANNNFSGGVTDSVAFSASTVALIAGDSELRFPISSIPKVYAGKIASVRFRIQATGNCTFRCLAIRALSANWVYAPMDYDTFQGRLHRTVSRSGATGTAIAFPSASGSNWPITFRSAQPPGTADPRPIDVNTSLVFNTGSLQVNSTTTVAVYLRELGLDENQQLDLTDTYTQADLDGYGTSLQTIGGATIWTSENLPGRRVQPDYGRALYDPRTQASLDQVTQANLDADTQFSLERIDDTLSLAYLEVKLTWIPGVPATLTIKDETGAGYTFAGITLTAQTNYSLLVDLNESCIRARIRELDVLGNIGALIFDSRGIIDGTFVHRRKGRVGWYAKLMDGDAYVEAFRPRSVNFGEFSSLPFSSDTPVKGARVTTHASENIELINALTAAPWGGKVTFDTSKSNSGYAYRIESDGVNASQGAITNPMYIDNLRETDLSFKLLVPQSVTISALLCHHLTGADIRIIYLPMPTIDVGQWESVIISLEPFYDKIQTGYYTLLLLQDQPKGDLIWYIDTISCKTRLLSWAGRGKPIDAWGMNADEWLPFKDNINDPNRSLVFAQRGAGMQVRAQAVRQTAFISDIQVQPEYAQLGNFAWHDQTVSPATPATALTPVAGLTSQVDQTVVVNSTASTFADTGLPYRSDNWIAAYIWSFGDGKFEAGPTATHTYEESGDYTITLKLMDAYGRFYTDALAVSV